jgi:hypothetical protein
VIALAVSLLLGLYIFLPVFLFDRLAASFFQLKRRQRSQKEEIIAGIAVAGIPFLIAFLLSHWSWYVGHWPFWMTDIDASKKVDDYKTVFAGFYSDAFFQQHISEFWESFNRVTQHQLRFLAWNYLLLLLEIILVVEATTRYGRLAKYTWFRKTLGKLLLSRVAEWHPLLTTFVFHPNEKRIVQVDLMTSDNHLYRGTVVEPPFIDRDGNLTGLLLKDAHRFQYSRLEHDRRSNQEKPNETYWKPIPGANLFIPYDKMVTMNLRYEMEEPVLRDRIRAFLKQIGVGDVSVVTRSSTEAHEKH